MNVHDKKYGKKPRKDHVIVLDEMIAEFTADRYVEDFV
jgi:hypothetical protein